MIDLMSIEKLLSDGKDGKRWSPFDDGEQLRGFSTVEVLVARSNMLDDVEGNLSSAIPEWGVRANFTLAGVRARAMCDLSLDHSRPMILQT